MAFFVVISSFLCSFLRSFIFDIHFNNNKSIWQKWEIKQNNIKIKKGFIEPKATKLSSKKHNINDILNSTSSIQADAIKNQKEPTINETSKSNKLYDGFIKGLFK